MLLLVKELEEIHSRLKKYCTLNVYRGYIQIILRNIKYFFENKCLEKYKEERIKVRTYLKAYQALEDEQDRQFKDSVMNNRFKHKEDEEKIRIIFEESLNKKKELK